LALKKYQHVLALLGSKKPTHSLNPIQKKSQTILCYCQLGECFARLRNFACALECFQGALKLQQTVSGIQHHHSVNTIVSIAKCNLKLNNFPLATSMFKCAYDILEDKFGKDETVVVECLIGLGKCNEAMGKYVNSLEYFAKAMKICESRRDNLGAADCYYHMGRVYLTRGENFIAMDFLERGLSMMKNCGDDELLGDITLTLAVAQKQTRMCHQALKNASLALLKYTNCQADKDKIHSCEKLMKQIYCDNRSTEYKREGVPLNHLLSQMQWK
jgi:tetratricopeptide (TPR) repeat protein